MPSSGSVPASRIHRASGTRLIQHPLQVLVCTASAGQVWCAFLHFGRITAWKGHKREQEEDRQNGRMGAGGVAILSPSGKDKQRSLNSPWKNPDKTKVRFNRTSIGTAPPAHPGLEVLCLKYTISVGLMTVKCFPKRLTMGECSGDSMGQEAEISRFHPDYFKASCPARQRILERRPCPQCSKEGSKA